MKDNLATLIKEYQKGNQECLLPIIEKLKPAIFKYSKKLFRDDFEDSVAEMELAVMESANKIPYAENEAQCLSFLINAIKNRYLELAKKSIKISDAEISLEEQFPVCPYWEYGYGNCELRIDLGKILSGCNAKQKKILLKIIFEGKNCALVAAELNITRQYVNRIKNKWLKQIKKEIFAKEAARQYEK